MARRQPGLGAADKERDALGRLVARLHGQFPEQPTERIQQLVAERHAEFTGRPVCEFVPILIERTVRAQLRAASH